MVAGDVSPRYVLALLEKLPWDSNFMVAVRGGEEFHGWDRQAYMLADLFDAVQYVAYLTHAANAKKAPKAPDPYPRPGLKDRKKKLQNPLIAALRGEDIVMEVGPGSVIPLPPKKK